MNKQNTNKLRYREQTEDCWMGGGVQGWVKKVKGLRSTNF